MVDFIDPTAHHFDAVLEGMDVEANKSLFRLMDGSHIEFDQAHAGYQIGAIGQLNIRDDGGFNFWPYVEQRLRRCPQEDMPAHAHPHLTHDVWAWKIEGSTTCIRLKAGITPGKNGAFIEDDTEPFTVDVPQEFISLCERYNLSVEDVFRGFMADACGLQNYLVNPRVDQFSSNGSDERDMAQDYLQRAYAMHAI
jgi:hypothetical protein